MKKGENCGITGKEKKEMRRRKMGKKEKKNVQSKEKVKKVKKPKLDKGRIVTKVIALTMVVMLVVGFAGTVLFYLFA